MADLPFHLKHVQDCLVVISCDGMSIRQDLSYSAKADEFHGFESDGNYRKCEKNNPAKLASEAVAVMVNVLYKPFKQVKRLILRIYQKVIILCFSPSDTCLSITVPEVTTSGSLSRLVYELFGKSG